MRSYRLLNDPTGQLIALEHLKNDRRVSKEDKSYYALQKGWIHRLERRFALAKIAYDEALELSSSHRGLIAIWQGELALVQDNLDEALAIWQEAQIKTFSRLPPNSRKRCKEASQSTRHWRSLH